jgi:hypothetical protein
MIIRRDKEDNIYAKLHRQALENIQALSGNRWTDFNAHDPGVTILENALYALTEMQYQLEFPLETYLFAHEKQPYAWFGLFPAEAIIAPSLVTPSDYEQLICENLPEVKNCRVSIADNGKYKIHAETDADKETVRKQIFKWYHTHRNLCETLDGIVFEDKIIPNDDRNTITDDRPQFVQPVQKEELRQSLPKAYYSFQYHFPNAYGVNEKGAPTGSSPRRKVQILQLKAYLLIFDYLLANILEQAGNVDDLLQLSDKIPSPSLPGFSIEDMNRLIDNERFNKSNLHHAEFWSEQKSRLFDVLDMLYGEDTKGCEKRIFLIRHFLQWNARRFRSFNLLEQGEYNIPEIAKLATAVFDSEQTSDVYWIEHILLDNYPEESNLLTVVQQAHKQRNTDVAKWESFLRERLPAHVDSRFLWLDDQKMSAFLDTYQPWRKALLLQDSNKIAFYGKELHDFLIRNF